MYIYVYREREHRETARDGEMETERENDVLCDRQLSGALGLCLTFNAFSFFSLSLSLSLSSRVHPLSLSLSLFYVFDIYMYI